MKKIFLDIGAHMGETIREVAKDEYNFDQIYAFEPSSSCHKELDKLAQIDDRITILKFGLGLAEEEKTLYGGGTLAASTYLSVKESPFKKHEGEQVAIKRLSDWLLANISPADLVCGKINCEGAEADIIKDLLRSNTLSYFYTLMITFDIRDFSQLAGMEGALRNALRRSLSFNFCFSDDVMIGSTHEDRLGNWLTIFGIKGRRLDSLAHYREIYRNQLFKYSRKRGIIARVESSLKRKYKYNNLPEIIKQCLRLLKRFVGLSRERTSK